MTEQEDNRVHFLLDHLNVTGQVTLNEEDMLLILRHQRELGKEDALAEMHDIGKLYSEIRADERNKTIEEVKLKWDSSVTDLIKWCKDGRLVGLKQADLIFAEILEQMKEGAENEKK